MERTWRSAAPGQHTPSLQELEGERNRPFPRAFRGGTAQRTPSTQTSGLQN